MRDRSSAHRIQVNVGVDPSAVDASPEVAAPCCIALLGDFSARAHRGLAEAGAALAHREPIPVDRDVVNEVLARLRPELHLHLQGDDAPAVRIQFAALEDFHPDRLYDRAPLFEGVRELRRRLETPGARSGAAASAPPGGLLDQILRQSHPPDEPSPLAGGDLQSYLNRIVAPYLVPAAAPRRQALLAELDAASASGMRALLHLTELQALEALWRGVDLITRQGESDAEVRLYLIDVTKAELAADQRQSSDPEDSELYRLLVHPPPGTAGWSVLGGLYGFSPDLRDLELLGRLGAVGRRLGAPWIAAADSRLVGCESIHGTPDPHDWTLHVDPRWRDLRRSPEAPWIGLAMPRVLVRAPYGEQASRCEALALEEFPAAPEHEQLLWGNPAVACLALLARAAAATGRLVYPGMDLELEGLPVVPIAGTGSVVPCAEGPLGERAAERILDGGMMAFVPTRDPDRVRLLRVQSVAEPSERLAGKWLGG